MVFRRERENWKHCRFFLITGTKLEIKREIRHMHAHTHTCTHTERHTHTQFISICVSVLLNSSYEVEVATLSRAVRVCLLLTSCAMCKHKVKKAPKSCFCAHRGKDIGVSYLFPYRWKSSWRQLSSLSQPPQLVRGDFLLVFEYTC